MITLLNILEFIKTIIDKFRYLLLILSIWYVIFVGEIIIKFLKLTPFWVKYKSIDDFLVVNALATHTIGILVLITYLCILYFNNKIIIKRILLLLKDGSENLNCSHMAFTEKEATNYLLEFTEDANEIFLLAGDADFINNKGRQYNELIEFGDRSHLLLNTNNKVTSEIIHQLVTNGVNIRTYNISKFTLRGRLKKSSYNKAACLFDKRKNGFHFLEIDNSAIVTILFDKYLKWYDKGRNPLIKYILFDLGNVYLDGDYHKFINKIEKSLSCKIPIKTDNYLCSSNDLNLGKIDILSFISTQIGRKLEKHEEILVIDSWNNTWQMNKNINMLAQKLRTEGYTICLASNCDKINADIYDYKNYLDVFHRRFFSFDVGWLKPSKKYYLYVLEQLNAKPFECLLIDDHIENINACNKLGINSVHISRSIPISKKAETIQMKLSNLSIP